MLAKVVLDVTGTDWSVARETEARKNKHTVSNFHLSRYWPSHWIAACWFPLLWNEANGPSIIELLQRLKELVTRKSHYTECLVSIQWMHIYLFIGKQLFLCLALTDFLWNLISNLPHRGLWLWAVDAPFYHIFMWLPPLFHQVPYVTLVGDISIRDRFCRSLTSRIPIWDCPLSILKQQKGVTQHCQLFKSEMFFWQDLTM